MEPKKPSNYEFERRFEDRRYHPIATLFLLDVFRDPGSRIPLLWAVGTLCFGAYAYHWIERWSYLDALYFCVVSLATVGYGDLAPKTPFGRAFTIVYIMNGVAILLALFDRIRVVRGRRIASRDQQATKDQ
jgi:voltage-gated potassium channel